MQDAAHIWKVGVKVGLTSSVVKTATLTDSPDPLHTLLCSNLAPV